MPMVSVGQSRAVDCWFIRCCHCDWCRLQANTLTIRSLGPLPLERGLVPNKQINKQKTVIIKIIRNIQWKSKRLLLLASNLLNPCSKLLRSLEILHHVTINHFTFFYISATLRPDSLSRQTWCELSKVSHSTCCLSCCWMVLVGPGPVSVRGGCLCLTWILCLCPFFFHSFFFFNFISRKRKC